jgi:hypothetical protein
MTCHSYLLSLICTNVDTIITHLQFTAIPSHIAEFTYIYFLWGCLHIHLCVCSEAAYQSYYELVL